MYSDPITRKGGLRKKMLLGIFALLALGGTAWAAGFTTNGLPTLPSAVSGALYPQLFGSELVAADTNLSGGQNPQSVAPTTFQIAALSACIAGNTSTATAGAATSSTQCGLVTTDSASTAAGANFTLTITNTMITAASQVQAAAYLGTSTAGAAQILSITPASGSVVILVKNAGSAAFNGTLKVAFATVRLNN